MYALRTVWKLPEVDRVALVVRQCDLASARDAVARQLPASVGAPGRLAIVPGAPTRRGSVAVGLEALAAAGPVHDQAVVLVHDAARPLATPGLFRSVIGAVEGGEGAVAPALAVCDSVRRLEPGLPCRVVEREGLFRVQTPQGFRFQPLVQVHRVAAASGEEAVDDLTLAEAAGIPPFLTAGEESNIKVTTPADWALTVRYLRGLGVPRVGTGLDVHPLEEGQGVVLGGVSIPCLYRLEGHSDADVVAHAVMDALLGAACRGDIGVRFPPTDPAWSGADSIRLLRLVWDELQAAGYLVGNVDATVLAEVPRLSPHYASMRNNLARAMSCDPGLVNVKATTAEGLGFVGHRQGVAAMAVVCLLDTSGPADDQATGA
jgi:2-C-methyl-D-erythritol 4-phosphate cytidylyltransferase/2-C-methyl-D-erythritol 2,4-cyclodiphosphate synthase